VRPNAAVCSAAQHVVHQRAGTCEAALLPLLLLLLLLLLCLARLSHRGAHSHAHGKRMRYLLPERGQSLHNLSPPATDTPRCTYTTRRCAATTRPTPAAPSPQQPQPPPPPPPPPPCLQLAAVPLQARLPEAAAVAWWGEAWGVVVEEEEEGVEQHRRRQRMGQQGGIGRGSRTSRPRPVDHRMGLWQWRRSL
jgi:hypothetical protein